MPQNNVLFATYILKIQKIITFIVYNDEIKIKENNFHMLYYNTNFNIFSITIDIRASFDLISQSKRNSFTMIDYSIQTLF